MSSLQIYQWVYQWKNFENRLTFGEVMGKSLVSCFFETQCISLCFSRVASSESGLMDHGCLVAFFFLETTYGLLTFNDLDECVYTLQQVVQPTEWNVVNIHLIKRATSSTVHTAALRWRSDVVLVVVRSAYLTRRLAGLICIVHPNGCTTGCKVYTPCYATTNDNGST